MKDNNNDLKKENETLNRNYYLLADEYNKLRKYNDDIEQQYIDLQKENEKLKNNQENPKDKENYNKLKEDNKKLNDDNKELEKENTKLKNDLNRNKSLQKVLDALRMNMREQSKNYKTEGISLDYLLPRDYEDDKVEKENVYRRVKRPIYKKYEYKSTTKKDDNSSDDKTKSEKAALALMRIRQAQEQRRQKDD